MPCNPLAQAEGFLLLDTTKGPARESRCRDMPLKRFEVRLATQKSLRKALAAAEQVFQKLKLTTAEIEWLRAPSKLMSCEPSSRSHPASPVPKYL